MKDKSFVRLYVILVVICVFMANLISLNLMTVAGNWAKWIVIGVNCYIGGIAAHRIAILYNENDKLKNDEQSN